MLLSADEGGPLYRRLNSLPMVTSVSLGNYHFPLCKKLFFLAFISP